MFGYNDNEMKAMEILEMCEDLELEQLQFIKNNIQVMIENKKEENEEGE